jgi:tetratricopeptide (TPR) repeat protein
VARFLHPYQNGRGSVASEIINEVTADSFRRQRPETLFAYDCVLRALEARRTQGREKLVAAGACLEEAVRRDPGYADAWELLSYSYLNEFRYGYGPRPYDTAALAQGVSTAGHAVELAPDGVLPLLALSTMHFYRREFAEAEEINRRLLARNPTNPEVLGQIGWRTAFARDWDEGIASSDGQSSAASGPLGRITCSSHSTTTARASTRQRWRRPSRSQKQDSSRFLSSWQRFMVNLGTRMKRSARSIGPWPSTRIS